MANTKRLREALLGSSKSAIESARSAVSGVADATGAVWLPIAEIAPDPDQPRTHYDETAMRQLRDSIASLGQIEPIVVQALGATERGGDRSHRYRCLSGHRRLRAHAELGLGEIKATVVRERLADEDRFKHEIAANEVREDHTDFDRARFLALVFAHGLGLDGDETARIDRVKYLVNRAFNELDRTGALSHDSAAFVETAEAALKALGERRNLRWFHRWGLPVLALTGAAREAAAAGLDARRALTIARLGARSGDKKSASARDAIIERVARTAREHGTPNRELGAVVQTIGSHLDDGTLSDEKLESLVARLGASADSDGGDFIATAESAAPRKRAGGRPSREPLGARAGALAERWALLVAPEATRRAGKGTATSLIAMVDALVKADPRGAERFVAALERADRELQALLAKGQTPAKQRHRKG